MKRCKDCEHRQQEEKQCKKYPALYPVNGEDTNGYWCGKFWRAK